MSLLIRTRLPLAAALLIGFSAQAQFTDDFSDGDFTSNPAWSGDNALFTVSAGQLRSNTGPLSAAATYYLSTPSTLAADAQWDFFVNLKFATSGVNYVDVYLMSDVQNLATPANGYFVRIGETLDHIVLNKIVSGTVTTLVSSPDNVVSSSSDNPFRIKVTRDASNMWMLQYVAGTTGNYLTAGTTTDASITNSAFFGIRVTQSTAASAVNNHFFGNFYAGSIIPTPPVIVSATATDDQHVDLLFNEPVDQASAETPGNYGLSPSNSVTSATRDGADLALVHLALASPMQNGSINTLSVNAVEDLGGSAIQNGSVQFIYALVEPVEAGDLVINEVLYDPRGSGSDFVELYNRSQKIVSLAGLKLSNINADQRVIIATDYLFMPGQYVAVATNTTNVLAEYPLGRADRMLQMALPTFNNASGRVVLLGASGDTLDLFNYSDALQFSLLKSVDGVSLERVDPDRPTSDNGNWHSAAENVNFATPGYKNSQYAPAPEAKGTITIDPAIFSPDNDGYQDLLTIGYQFDEPGFVGTMKVFDIAGREVRMLMDNELLGTSGAVSWDGLMDGNDLARIGPYIIYLEAYDLAGNVEKFRKSVVLAHRL